MATQSEWSSDWSKSSARRRSEPFLFDHIRPETTERIRDYLRPLLKGLQPGELSLESVAATRQSANVVESGTRSLILFDVLQSLVLMQLLGMVRDGRSARDIVSVIAGCAGLAVSDRSPIHCHTLLSVDDPDVDIDAYFTGSALDEWREVLEQTLPQLLLKNPTLLVNANLLAHEVAHLTSVQDDEVIRWCRTVAEESFDFAMDQHLHVWSSSFAELAQPAGQVHLPPEASEQLRQETIRRMEHWKATRAALVDEITCDVHGLFITGRFLQTMIQTSDDPEEIEANYQRFALTFYLLTSLTDLHRGMIRWVELSLETGTVDDRPGHIADAYFRKIALVKAMARHLWCVFLPDHAQTDEQFDRILQPLGEAIVRLKGALDSLIHSPAAMIVHRTCKSIENEQQAPPQLPAAPPAWRDHDLGRLFGHANLHQAFDDEGVRLLSGVG